MRRAPNRQDRRNCWRRFWQAAALKTVRRFRLENPTTLHDIMTPMTLRLAPSTLAPPLLLSTVVRAVEGMWRYSAAPREQIKKKYGFTIADAWLEHLMKSSVRFDSGGSGSFVSADGLVITIHHVGADDLQKLSDEKNNYM